MTLTNQQLLQLFMLYPNAPIVYKEKLWAVENITLRGLLAGRIDLIELNSKYSTRDTARTTFTQCKLLLRSIDQLSEQEKKDVLELLRYNPKYCDLRVLKGTGSLYNALEVDTGNDYIRFTKFDLPYPAADYLRSINVAIPFLNYDLVEEGVVEIQKKD